MQKINDDVQVIGTLRAAVLDGQLSDACDVPRGFEKMY